MSSQNLDLTMRRRRDSDTPDPEALFVSDNRREVDLEPEYSGPEDYEDGLEQADSDGDPFASSAQLGIQGTTGGTAADHERLHIHTVAQGAGNGSHPAPSVHVPQPKSQVEVPKYDSQKAGFQIPQSAYNMPDPKSRRRPIHTRAADPATASRRESQRGWRWTKYGFLIDQFAKDTEGVRMWYQHAQAQKGVWNLERARIDREMAEMKAVIAKMKQDKVNMNAAQSKLEEDHGDEIENGRICQEKLTMWTGYLKMENDAYPDELEGRDEDDAKEELEAFQEDAAKEGNEDLCEDVEGGEDEVEVVEDQIDVMEE